MIYAHIYIHFYPPRWQIRSWYRCRCLY